MGKETGKTKTCGKCGGLACHEEAAVWADLIWVMPGTEHSSTKRMFVSNRCARLEHMKLVEDR